MTDSDAEERAREYCESHFQTIVPERFGGGTDGSLWKTTVPTVVKVFLNRHNYELEYECYRRLEGVSEICLEWDGATVEFSIPRMLGHDHELMVIEMDVVDPPHILDFGKVSLDAPREFPEETKKDNELALVYWFGPYARLVKRLLFRLEKYGIYYEDARLGNIMIPGYEPDI